MNIKKLTEFAMTIALSVVLSFIKVWEMPQGGSVSLVMVPLLVISFRRGISAGMITGAIYGCLSALLSGVIYHPMSLLLDYIIAFSLVGLAGLFKTDLKGIISGCFVGVFGRFLSSYLSGAILFASYAPEGQSPWLYSLVYQATYLIPELIISAIVIILIRNKILLKK